MAKLKSTFTKILQLARILVRAQGLDLHDIPQFFHLDFKVVDNVFGSVEVPQEGVGEEDDSPLPFAPLGDIRPRMSDDPGMATETSKQPSFTLFIRSHM